MEKSLKRKMDFKLLHAARLLTARFLKSARSKSRLDL